MKIQIDKYKRVNKSESPSLEGTVHPQKIFLKYVMLRTVTKNLTIIITKYT